MITLTRITRIMPMREHPARHLDHPAGSAVPTVNKKPM